MNVRIGHYDRSADPARPEYDEHVIYCFWHEYISVVLPRWGHTPLTVLCSHHRDGELVNQIASSLGLNIVRGSTNRGGLSAIRKLKRNSAFSSFAITPDGPRGPRRELAMGPIYLASVLKMPIVPIGVGISKSRRLDTWDRFALPRLSSRVRMVFGPKVRVPKRLNRDALENMRAGVEHLLNDLTKEAESWAESKRKLIGEQPFVRARHCNRMVLARTEEPVVQIFSEPRFSEPRQGAA